MSKRANVTSWFRISLDPDPKSDYLHHTVDRISLHFHNKDLEEHYRTYQFEMAKDRSATWVTLKTFWVNFMITLKRLTPT